MGLGRPVYFLWWIPRGMLFAKQSNPWIHIMPVSKAIDVNIAYQEWKDAADKVQAWERFVPLLERMAYSICRQSMARFAKDVPSTISNAIWRTYNSLDKFRGNSQFSTWFHKIVINECNRTLRKIQRMNEVALPTEADETFFVKSNPDKTLLARELLTRLDKETKNLVRMQAFGLSMKEIGESFGISEPAARKRWERAKNMLERMVEDDVFE